MARYFILFILLLPCIALAQFTISGRVQNNTDYTAVANANVFLSNATIGDKTRNNGEFTLHDVKPGKYELVVSIIGFDVYRQMVIVTTNNIALAPIDIFPNTITLNEVKIKPRDDPDWQRNFDWFKSQFLGTTDLSKECKIINPELLDLNYDEKTETLTAKSVDFMIIENQALGYKIKYLLSGFMMNNNDKRLSYTGSVLFEEMKGTNAQKEQWKRRRLEVYEGSKTHFLRAALNNRISQEGFRVLRFTRNPERPPDSVVDAMIKVFTMSKDKSQHHDSLSFWKKKSKLPKLLAKPVPYPLNAGDIVIRENKQGLFAFGCDGDALYISYNKRHHFSSASLPELFDPANTTNTLIDFIAPNTYFDNNGIIANPESLVFSGAWINNRLAGLLPLDYEPQQNTEVPSDSTFLKKITLSLNDYIIKNTTEKAYIHFDKPNYAAGDTIYFKAYVTMGPHHEPSTLSGILNVELISPDNKICESVRLKLNEGVAWGDFALPDTFKQGSYRLRAYTNWMRNAGEEYFFDKYFSLVNASSVLLKLGKINNSERNKNKSTQILQSKAISGKTDVQFFPEGGSLVNGVLSKIAFKAVGANGLGTEIKGNVTDEQGKQVSTFSSQYLGMGIITLTPQTGKIYKANMIFADSSTKTIELPKAGNTGYALNVDNSDSRNVTISVVEGKENAAQQMNLVAQAGGIIYYSAKGKFVNKKFTDIISKSRFPTGIVQITLFSEAGEPMNERLVFIQNPDQLNLNIVTEKQSYAPRQNVKINLTASNNSNTPVSGSFSVAVIDETKVPVDEDSESTILSDLLLTSDLKGYVENPNYYFTGKSNTAGADLDVLMLTQGYHRFEWQQILNDQFPAVNFPPEKVMVISGSIKNHGGKPIPYADISLLSLNGNNFFLDTIAEADGKFKFEHLPIKDSMRYMIQATDKKIRSNSIITMDNINPSEIGKNKNAPDGQIKFSNDLSTFLQRSIDFHKEQLKQGIVKQVITLKEVTVKDKRTPSKYLAHSSNLNGPGNANDVITADQFPLGCPVFTDCIAGHMHGIRFIGGTPYYEGFPVLVTIDGSEVYTGTHDGVLSTKKEDKPPLSVADILNASNINDIASVEFLMDAGFAAIYGVKAGGAVIVITTKRGDDDISSNNSIKPDFAYYLPKGYYKARVFYSPEYEPSKTNTPLPDLRTTIYWKPGITTDQDGKASFSFFNADGKGTYRIVIEGIDDNGNLGRQLYHYKVE